MDLSALVAKGARHYLLVQRPQVGVGAGAGAGVGVVSVGVGVWVR